MFRGEVRGETTEGMVSWYTHGAIANPPCWTIRTIEEQKEHVEVLRVGFLQCRAGPNDRGFLHAQPVSSNVDRILVSISHQHMTYSAASVAG